MNNSTQHSTRRRLPALRWALLGFAVLMAAILFSGCGTPSAPPLSRTELSELGKTMVSYERMTPDEADATDAELKKDARSADKVVVTRAAFLRGYLAEAQQAKVAEDERDYSGAAARYQEAMKGNTSYSAHARYRYGVLGVNNLLGPDSLTEAKREFQMLSRSSVSPFSSAKDPVLWVRSPELAGTDGPAAIVNRPESGKTIIFQQDAPFVATQRLDPIYRDGGGTDGFYYRVVDQYVRFFKAISPGFGVALALIVLALLIKLVTIPMTNASFRGMRDMQRVQPMIKELQEKYKDDKAKLAEEQMKLMKEHKVNPMGGCLPMLIQLPIFWVVYRAVQVYAAGFADAQFLWVQNLARPDFILLVLYAISMIVTQKLTATPTTDPQQKMMQQYMTFMMPLMLLFVLMPMASAFVLYWFFLNVFSSIHQYYLMQQFKREDEARAAAAPVPAPKGPGKKKGK